MSARLSNDDFLASLTTLLSAPHAKGHGSIYLTQKPLSSTPESPDSANISTQILIRATNGVHISPKAKIAKSLKKNDSKKVKLSTVVEVVELESFYAKYAEVCKRGMEGLRKRDKKKAKLKEKAKKKKGGVVGKGA